MSRPSSPLLYNLWTDDLIETFDREMRSAKRTAFLAIRAVEYETQSSFAGIRDDVLAARVPDDLDEALDTLDNQLNTGTVAGGAPSQLLAVVSLRDDVLQIETANDEDSEGQGDWLLLMRTPFTSR